MHAIEWAEFSLRPSVTPTELVAAAVAMQRQFLDNQRGYVSRQLLAIGPDRYADLVTWRTRDAADAAIARAAEYAACRNYFALLYVDKQPVHGIPLLPMAPLPQPRQAWSSPCSDCAQALMKQGWPRPRAKWLRSCMPASRDSRRI